jgi:hypothetical protein
MAAAPDLLNRGFIINRPAAWRPGRRGRTFIVTGLHRSGTSLAASILKQAGIFIGDEINDIVFEDEAIARVLASRDTVALQRIIGERDADYRTWGFKQPMLCNDLDAGQLALFNDPHLIVTFRDPVSISVRASLSEYREPTQALSETMRDLNALMAFLGAIRCPVLLLSYEKALMFPGDFVDAVMQFCHIPRNAALRTLLLGVIEPNRPGYIAGARRRYEGTIEGIIYGHLNGWCRMTHSDGPVTLEVLVDGCPVREVVADTFRQDLLDARLGRGNHGFSIALEALGGKADAVIRVRVAGRDIEIDNSGRPLREFLAEATRDRRTGAGPIETHAPRSELLARQAPMRQLRQVAKRQHSVSVRLRNSETTGHKEC